MKDVSMGFKRIGFYSVYSEDIFDDDAVSDRNASDWVFILGPQRSGTSVLANSLNLHPDCIIHNESNFLFFFKFLLHNLYLRSVNAPFYKRWNIDEITIPMDTEPTCNLVNFNPFVDNINAFVEELYENSEYLYNMFNYDDLRNYAEAYRNSFTKKSNTKIFGDKCPAYIFIYEDILKAFPKSRIIVTNRNVMDMVASIHEKIVVNGAWENKQNVFFEKNMAEFIYQQIKKVLLYSIRVKEMQDDLDARNVSFFLAQYEHMAENPINKYNDILEFLGLDSTKYDWQKFTHHYNRNLYNWRDRLPEEETTQAIDRIILEDDIADIFKIELEKSK